ncbi:MAG: hypothetical protein KJ645_03100 [Planctomycetes bacterium]|nr:hypothetical protein [Planctomycetota bacterium]
MIDPDRKKKKTGKTNTGKNKGAERTPVKPKKPALKTRKEGSASEKKIGSAGTGVKQTAQPAEADRKTTSPSIRKKAASGSSPTKRAMTDAGTAKKRKEAPGLKTADTRKTEPSVPAGIETNGSAEKMKDSGPPGKELAETLQGIREELKSLRLLLLQAKPMIEAETGGPGLVLEESVNSLRRLLSEMLEDHMETVIHDLVAIRSSAAAEAPDRREALLLKIDRLLNRIGAISFEAEPLDYLDPIIHTPIAEKSVSDAPDDVVLETVAPGFRTGRGTVVARAAVVVNRRP